MDGTRLPLIVDAHSDLLLELVHAQDVLGEACPLGSRWLPRLRAGGVALQACAIYVEPDESPGDGLRAVLRQASAFGSALAEDREAVFAVRSQRDLEHVGADAGRIGLLLSLEGAASLAGDVWLLDVLATLGVRMASLTWNERNAFAGGCSHPDGLTPAGELLVDRMSALGIAVDLAHASPRTVTDVLAMARGPVVISHAACRALHDHPRNLADAQLTALAANGGVLGLMPHPLVLGTTALDGFLDHVDHAVGIMGVEHVGLGGDFLRQIVRALGEADEVVEGMRMDAAIAGLAGPEDYPPLAAALRCRGYDDAAQEAILGGNLLRLLRHTLPDYAPACAITPPVAGCASPSAGTAPRRPRRA